MKGAPPNWLAYFASNDVDAHAKKVTDLGGKVLAPPMDIPGSIGRFAIVQDPQGAVFGLFKQTHA
jgi:predicted enzyme related to lactoylglutathione lyase